MGYINYMEYPYPNEEVCIPAREWSTMVKYYWTGPLFNEENRKYLISAKQLLSRNDALNFYAWGKQAKFGDNPGPKPPVYNIVATLKYNAWDAIRGHDRLECTNLFLEAAKPMLATKGLDYDRP